MRKQENEAVGIKDIAQKANVSIGTVDRVLHNRGEVAKATRERVLKIIEELDYTPNILAQSLASKKKKHHIAVLIPNFKNNNPYWERPLAGIYQAAGEIKNYNFEITVYTYELGNEKSVTSNAKEIFKQKPDGLIFAPLMYNVSNKVINQCQELNIPYVFIDVNIDNRINLAYFGQNSFQSGYVAARLLDYGLSAEAEIHIIKLVNKSVSSYHLSLRENGFLSYFKTAENKEKRIIISNEIDISENTAIYKAFNKIIAKSVSSKGIFVPNSRVYHLAKYLEESKQMNNLVIGYDLINENLYYLKKDVINFLISQQPEAQGYNSVIALFSFLTTKKPLQKFNFSPIDIIIKENIDFYSK